MPAPVIDFQTYLKRIPQHTTDLHEEASVPLRHYRRTANDAWNLRLYV